MRGGKKIKTMQIVDGPKFEDLFDIKIKEDNIYNNIYLINAYLSQ